MALISVKLMLSWKKTLEKWGEQTCMLGWKRCALNDRGELNRKFNKGSIVNRTWIGASFKNGERGFASPYADPGWNSVNQVLPYNFMF